MAKITHIGHARQRYEMEPVLDADGNQAVQKIKRAGRNGQQIEKKLTRPNKSKPLPLQECELGDGPIQIGDPYQVCAIKRQFGATYRIRHESCPTWQPWEYTDALWARIAQIQNEEVDPSDWEEADAPSDRAGEIAEMIRELSEEKQEALDNMPDALRDASEYASVPDDLNNWADEVEQATGSETFPEKEDHPNDDAYKEALENWREDAAQAIRDALDNSPV